MSCPEMMELEGFLSRELDRETSARIADHLASCEQCSRELGELENDLRLAHQLRNHQPVCGVDLPTPSAEVPEVIGPYRILRKLGEGGMGTVFEAQQEHPRRIVALKILRPSLVSETLLARFRREAQTLGRLQHPGIAQIYEASTYESVRGRQPYFVMELIRGPGLMEYAQTSALSVGGRLELMAKVCDAVQHAHQRGVIHRDLKPDNILIDESGDEPQPKILDFGVARVIDPQQRATTLHTSVGQIVGTVAYMSPEQASAEPSDVDTRSDVYGLGVICYELLAARLPYSINKTSIVESVRAIVQDEPTPLATVDRSLRGDVSTIVGKTLEKDKARRYQSAAEMAADIRRHLRDEPISAHPPSTVYQLRKFARRNKALVGGVAAAVVLLIAGIIGTSIGMLRAQRAQFAAETSATTARREADKANAVNHFLNEMLKSANPTARSIDNPLRGRHITVLQVLDEAVAKLDSGTLKAEPAIEAAVRSTIGQSYAALGEYAKGEPHLLAALEINRRTPGIADAEIARNLHLLGIVAEHLGKTAEAEAFHRESLALSRKHPGEQSSQVAEALIGLAALLRDQGNLPEAESLARQALDIRMKVSGEHDAQTAETMNLLGLMLLHQGKIADAEPFIRRALDTRRKRLGADHPQVAASLESLGLLLVSQNQFAEAEERYRQSLKMSHQLLGDAHPQVAAVMGSLGTLLADQQRPAEAAPMLRRAIEIYRQVFGDEYSEIPKLQGYLAFVLEEQGQFDQAESLYRQALTTVQKRYGDDHTAVAVCRQNLGGLLVSARRYDEAEPLLRDALASHEKRLGPASLEVGLAHMKLGVSLIGQGKFNAAEPELAAARRVLDALLSGDDPRRLGAIYYSMRLYEKWDKPERAAPLRAALPESLLAPMGSPTTQPSAR